MSTETVRTIRDREPSTATLTFTQLLSSAGVSVLSCVWGRTAGHSLQCVGLHLICSGLCVTHTKASIWCLQDNNRTNQKYQFHNQAWKKRCQQYCSFVCALTVARVILEVSFVCALTVACVILEVSRWSLGWFSLFKKECTWLTDEARWWESLLNLTCTGMA